jgi:hypothetical protein
MDKTCIVSVAFRRPYVAHSKTQEECIREVNPEVDLLYFRDELPSKSGIIKEDIVDHFQRSLYGFKPHAIRKAIELGYKKIIWFDPAVLPTTSVSHLIESLDTHPMIVRTGDQELIGMVNKKALNWFEVTENELCSIKHVGGTIYAFNFNDPKVVEVFDLWKKAEEDGIFGNQDDFMNNHWADEACMSLAMYKIGIPQYYEESFKYLNQKEL